MRTDPPNETRLDDSSLTCEISVHQVIQVISVVLVLITAADIAVIVYVYLGGASSYAGAADTGYLEGHRLGPTLVRLFDFDEEANLPTWVSSILLLACSAVLCLITAGMRKLRAAQSGHWMGLSMIFLAMSLDEVAQLHERLSGPLREEFHFGGALRNAWVIPAMLFLAGFGIAYARFTLRLPPQSRRRFIVAFFVYVSGALIMEMLDTDYGSLHGERNIIYAFLTTIEEGTEMLGTTLFLHALLVYWRDQLPRVRVGVRQRERHPPSDAARQ